MEGKKKPVVFPIIQGTLVAYAVTTIFIFVYAFLLANTGIPESSIPVCMIMICMISIVIGSSLSSFKKKERGLINGAVIGLCYIMILYVVSSMLVTGFGISGYSFTMMVFCVLAGILGGIVGVNLS